MLNTHKEVNKTYLISHRGIAVAHFHSVCGTTPSLLIFNALKQNTMEVQKTGTRDLISSNVITTIKDFMKNYKPTNKIEAIRLLAFLSASGNAADAKRLKDLCYSFLSDRCAEWANAVDPETGLEVVRVEREVKVFNQSDKVDKITADIEKLKLRLKTEQEKAGVAKTISSVYYKVS